jgi:hypothetical protein
VPSARYLGRRAARSCCVVNGEVISGELMDEREGDVHAEHDLGFRFVFRSKGSPCISKFLIRRSTLSDNLEKFI